MVGDVRKFVRMAAVLFFSLTGIVAMSWAQNGDPWQIGDVVVCYGSGNCNVIRLVNGTTPTLLDSLNDGLTGSTSGTAINNTLHLLTTDNGGGNASNLLQWSIASVNPLNGNNVSHSVLNQFNAGGSNNSGNVQAVVVNSAGHFFVANANPATIVELGPKGNLLNTYPLATFGCSVDTQLGSIDLSADGKSFYLTSQGGTIQKFTPPSTCSVFANFGPGVKLYTIKDIPAGALSGQSCAGVPCPADETLLVTATGYIDDVKDADAVNICTNDTTQTPLSCALLVDTNPNPGFPANLWKASNLYSTLGTNILDPNTQVQSVYTAGTSGTDEPTFNDTTAGGFTIDNAVKWTDIPQPIWHFNNAYSVGTIPAPGVAAIPNTYFVDPNGHLETVSQAGISGPFEPGMAGNPVVWNTAGGTTIDGLQWQDQHYWTATTPFAIGTAVGDAAGHPHVVLTAGTSGAATPAWNDTGLNNGGLTAPGVTIDNAVIWTNLGAAPTYAPGKCYGPGCTPFLGNYTTAPNNRVQKVLQPGTSGSTTPVFIPGGQTIDGAVSWTDQGQDVWHPDFAFASGAVVVDPAGHVQQVTTAGVSGTTQPKFSDSGSTTTDGLQWTDQGQLVTTGWQAGTAFSAPQIILDGNNHFQEVVVTGTSGASSPTFNTNGGYTLDQSVVWLDLGQNLSPWTANASYPQNAVLEDTNQHVQLATDGGKSGPNPPGFTTNGGSVADNAIVWTDETALQWAANFAYSDTTAATTFIVDSGKHVQQATISGTSGPIQPVFIDVATTTDNGTLVWTNEGQAFWYSGVAFAANAIIVDAAGHVQQATTAGVSGPLQPVFVDGASPGGAVTDGLQWTDQGAPGTWTANASPAVNSVILDSNSHIQQVVAATGSTSSSAPTFSTSGGLTVDSGVVWIDRGATASWVAGTSYPVNAVVLDSNSPAHVQQATSAGTSGSSAPVFSTAGQAVADNAVVWTDEGLLAGNVSFTWQSNNPYSLNSQVVDSKNFVQKVTAAGTSGASQPSFNDGNTLTDGLIWQDIGAALAWTPSTIFSAAAAPPYTLTIGNGYVQQATTAGISGTPNPPSWNPILNGMTVDGLTWSDYGPSTWTANKLYAGTGTLISELAAPYHAQQVYEAGTAGAAAPTFNHSLGLTPDNAVFWTESSPNPARMASTAYVLNSIVVDSFTPPHVQQASLAGTTGPNGVAFNDNGGTVVDGLQWKNATATSSVVARYQVGGSTVQVQSLALDPLIADCTSNKCQSAAQPITISKFWLGDRGSGMIYAVNFDPTRGGPTSFDLTHICSGNNCSISSIQGLALYGGEGSNQPDLTKLFSGTLTPAAPGNTAAVQFPLPFSAASTNSFTVSAYSLQQSYGTNLYASLVDPASCFGDPSPGTPSLPCEPTTPSGNPIVWKTDIPTNGLALTSPAYVSEKVKAPVGVDVNTDVFTDAFYDTTVTSGNIDPVSGNRSSVEVLFERGGANLQYPNAGCVYSSPMPGACYKTNRGTLNFTFQCPGLTQSQFLSLQNPPGPPMASLVQILPPNSKGVTPSPKIIFLTASNGTNGKGPYRYSSSGNNYTFQWNVTNAVNSGQISGTGTTNLTLYTYDEGVLPPFGVSFKTDPSCK